MTPSSGESGAVPLLQLRHTERESVSNYRRLFCLLNCLFKRRPKKTSKLRVTGFCEGNSPVTSELPARKASNAENVTFDDVIMLRRPIMAMCFPCAPKQQQTIDWQVDDNTQIEHWHCK